MSINRHAAGAPLLLLALFLGAALLRLPGMTRSLGHDEIYTQVIFASRPWLDILTSYHLPNNHILHTLCVRIASAVFGDPEWSLRLPALLAGLLSVPVLYGFCRRLTQSGHIAGTATLLLTISPVHIAFSRQARGYTILLLLGMIHAWALLNAIWQRHVDADPPDREWLPWVLAAGAGALAVLTLPSAAFLVGACAFAGAALIGVDLPPDRRQAARRHMFLSTAFVIGVTATIYVPHLDELYSHAERFGVPLSPTTWPGFVADVWSHVGPQRLSLGIAVATAAGAGLLLAGRRGAGLYLLGGLCLPLVFSLGVATGGQPRVYVYLLPFICIAVAVAADAVQRRLQRYLPADSRWSPLLLTVITVAPLAAAFGNLPAPANETGYRAAGRWVREQTVPGDVIIAPYIVDSAIGYYSRGATVQRLRDAVRVGPRRLFVMTRPGTARFEFGDLMLTSNFTTDAANHLDAHRSWVLPAEAFETIAHFGRSTVSRPRKKLQRIDLGELTATGGWQLYAQTSEDAPQWGERRLADGRLSLQLRLQVGAAAVLHSVQTFTPAQDGLVLLGYAQQGTAYVSLLQMMQQQPQAMQMAKVVSASASVGDRGDGSEWFHELYMCPVRAGVRYGLYVTAADGGTADVANCTISFVPL